jgi:hypothetical protein
MPCFKSMRERFDELQDPRYVSAFTEAAEELIRIAKHFEPRIGRHLHVDSTDSHSHMTLEHACPNRAICKALREQQLAHEVPAKQVANATTDEVKADRHKRSQQPEEVESADDEAQPAQTMSAAVWTKNKLYKLTDDQAAGLNLDTSCRWYLLNGHFLRCLDKSAGVRMYRARRASGNRLPSKRKVWVGDYCQAAVDHFTGAPVAMHFFSCDINEHLEYERLLDMATRALAETPTTVSTDAGFAQVGTYRTSVTRGITLVAPERDPGGNVKWEDLATDRYDADGMLRCKHCGGITTQTGTGLGFVINGVGDPRLRYRCSYPWTDDCHKVQTISCLVEPRVLLPLGRLNRTYHELRESHQTFERVFDHWRDRYAVAGNTIAVRSKRRESRPAQQLRAAAAMLAEWLRICMRHGWVGNHKTLNAVEPEETTHATQKHDIFCRRRRMNGLNLPRGQAAENLGLAGTTARMRDRGGPGGPAPPGDDADDERPF